MDPSPNIYTVLIALIQMIGTAFAVWIAYRQTLVHNRHVAAELASKVEETTIQTTSKLEEVHKTVNGNLDAEKKKGEKYAAKLREHGIDPDAE